MSQYTQFFIRNKDVFLPIGTYCRSSRIAEAFQYVAPYEAIAPVTSKMIDNVKAEIRNQIDDYSKTIKHVEQENDFLRTCEMETSERVERYADNIELIDELKESQEACQRAWTFVDFLEDILQEAKMEREWGENPLQLNENSYVYVGIEVGTPTTEDIKD